jgi:purine-nucleoside phosphorylase
MTGNAVVDQAVEAVRRELGGLAPRVAIVLGSGLGTVVEAILEPRHIPYAKIPGFPAPLVPGHKGELMAGALAGVPVLAQRGRFHLYEGHSAATAALPVRVFHRLGIRTLVVTNAAGSLHPRYRPGSLMLIADHINLMWRNPLIGPVAPGEERFPDMSGPYSPALRTLARKVAAEARIPLEEGVYVGLLGPSYETPAEIRMLQRLGGDAVGMSTVPEVITAGALGMRTLGFSMITNLAAGLSSEKVSHEEVLTVGQRVSAQLRTLLEGVVADAF